MESNIMIQALAERKVTDTTTLPFGMQPTEHMFIAAYRGGAWQDARIQPFGELKLSPFALGLHYGQTVFEGMKAFRATDGGVHIFRPRKHHERFSRSLQRMCMPVVPEGLFTEALHQLVRLDAGWVPEGTDGSLYIRPFMIATESRLGVKISDEYLFMIVCTPAYQYYSKPLKVKIETEYVRAADGGTGSAKCGGNYGGVFYPSRLAQEAGFDQVLWTDSRHHEFIEESGTMNIMFHLNGTLVTPPLSGTILDGITRDSLLTLAREKGIPVSERPVSYKELQNAIEAGERVEAFGTGTAAVIAPIETIACGDKSYPCYIGPDALMYSLADTLLRIRKGDEPDTHGWNYRV